MYCQATGAHESLSTCFARIHLLTRVHSHVPHQAGGGIEIFIAFFAMVQLTRMGYFLVESQPTAVNESLSTYSAKARLPACVLPLVYF